MAPTRRRSTSVTERLPTDAAEGVAADEAVGAGDAAALNDAAALAALAEWQRTSPRALFVWFGAVVKSSFRNAASSVGTLGALVAIGIQSLLMALLVLIGLAVLAGIVAALRYWFFRFRLEEDRIRVREGVLKRSDLNVQLERIQGVHLEQSPPERLLRLATVTFDTAGSAMAEGRLPGMPLRFAEPLRRRIESARGPDASDEPAEIEPVGAKVGSEYDDTLARLRPADLVRVGLTDPKALIVLSAAAGFTQLTEPMRDYLVGASRQVAAEVIDLGVLLGVLVVWAAAIALAALLAAASIAAAFLRYHGFALREDAGTLRIGRGLLTRKQTQVPIRKIQQLSLAQGPVMRWFGGFRLRLLPPSGGLPRQTEGPEEASEVMVPWATPAVARSLAAKALPPECAALSLLPRDDAFRRISAVYVRSRLIVVGIVPAGTACAALLPSLGLTALYALAWIPLVALGAWRRWRRYGFCSDEHGLSCRRGLVHYKVQALPLRKAQSVTIRRSLMQRRAGLATLEVWAAPDSLAVPFIDLAEARRLRDHILFKVESSREPWY